MEWVPGRTRLARRAGPWIRLAPARAPACAGTAADGGHAAGRAKKLERCSSCGCRLSGAEGDDAADRIVGRDPDGHAVARHDLDAKSPHPAAQLRQHFVSGVALHTVEA